MRLLACPYCYEQFKEREILFRCAGLPAYGGRERCKPVIDPTLRERLGQSVALPPTFDGNGKRTEAVHAACGVVTNYRICPFCHSTLPVRFGKVGNQLIALIGAKDSGKTVFVTVLLHELQHGIGRRFDAAVAGADDETRKAFTTEYEDGLYRRNVLPQVTRSAGGRGGVVKPLVFRFTTERRGRRGPTVRHALLSFFDTAGEDLQSRDQIDANVRYLASADGIILLLDPLQLEGAREHTRNKHLLPQRSNDDNPINLLGRVTDLLLDKHARAQRIGKPIAVAFSKLDELWHMFPDGDPVRRASGYLSRPGEHRPRDPGFDVQDSLDVHGSIEAILDEWDGGQIDRNLRGSWARFRYFGLSALGASPTADKRVDRNTIAPHRVADPFLWLLSEFGIIPQKRG